jgi:hypothetical protein
MGWIVHNAIIVTTFSQGYIERAHTEARRIFNGIVTDPVESGVNGYRSFLIPPDGSKEGWPASDEGDRRRAEFHSWVAAQAYEDGSSAYGVVEVAYGEVRQPVIVAVDGRETQALVEGR